jgi:hypothetical protein
LLINALSQAQAIALERKPPRSSRLAWRLHLKSKAFKRKLAWTHSEMVRIEDLFLLHLTTSNVILQNARTTGLDILSSSGPTAYVCACFGLNFVLCGLSTLDPESGSVSVTPQLSSIVQALLGGMPIDADGLPVPLDQHRATSDYLAYVFHGALNSIAVIRPAITTERAMAAGQASRYLFRYLWMGYAIFTEVARLDCEAGGLH